MLNSIDTSARKKDENSILQFKQVLDVMVAEVYIFFAETLKFSYVNQAAINRRGMSEEELLGKTPLDFPSEGNISRAQMRLKPLLDGTCDALQYESIDFYQSGEKMYADVSLQCVDDGHESFAEKVKKVRDDNMAREEFYAIKLIFTPLFTPLGQCFNQFSNHFLLVLWYQWEVL